MFYVWYTHTDNKSVFWWCDLKKKSVFFWGGGGGGWSFFHAGSYFYKWGVGMLFILAVMVCLLSFFSCVWRSLTVCSFSSSRHKVKCFLLFQFQPCGTVYAGPALHRGVCVSRGSTVLLLGEVRPGS